VNPCIVRKAVFENARRLAMNIAEHAAAEPDQGSERDGSG
jgi:hypothetical protein